MVSSNVPVNNVISSYRLYSLEREINDRLKNGISEGTLIEIKCPYCKETNITPNNENLYRTRSFFCLSCSKLIKISF